MTKAFANLHPKDTFSRSFSFEFNERVSLNCSGLLFIHSVAQVGFTSVSQIARVRDLGHRSRCFPLVNNWRKETQTNKQTQPISKPEGHLVTQNENYEVSI